ARPSPHPPPAAPTPPSSGTSAAAQSQPAAPPRRAPAPTGPVQRPNGQTYHPRQLAEVPDVAALRRLREAGIAALLYGPPGTGKTSLVEAAFPDLITVAGDGDTAVADFVGEYTQAPDGGYEFVYGPLVTAMSQGRCLFIDDATLISPKVLAVVYPAMDGRRQIVVKAHKVETVTAEPGFYVIAGHNPGVHGAVLTEALASRFAAQIRVSTDYDLARTLRIDPKAVRVARNLAARQSSGEIGWAPQLRELIAFDKIAGVLGTDAAVANLAGIAPEEDRDVVVAVLSSVYGRAITPLALGRQL
ncbi:AAA family ATPase, partial [Actinomadura sp. 6K520]|uniref:AAA family ATPase n=1 Tax=Actinomadura sp. 6K520 TaxID=2530364 RepID=UPI001A9D2609